jgi:Ser/Thr protein kinase RdoA (MazF antagonist)
MALSERADELRHAVEQWNWDGPVAVEAIDSGLINRSFQVRVGDRAVAVLQRLNSEIFIPEVNLDIEAVTSCLARRNVPTPRLLPTRSGELWATLESGVWRCLTVVGERTIDRLDSPAEARSAGHLVARFHVALEDLEWRFRSLRRPPQDTELHLANLQQALADHRGHRLYPEVRKVADQVLGAWHSWQGPAALPRRVIHGDLKISNVRFSGSAAVALIDLDTLAHGTIDAELGDAFRSWCNRAGEDQVEADFDLGLFAAAVAGYAAGAGAGHASDEEWASLVPGLERIALTLSARFAADALQESYFGWDSRYGGRGEHNLLRAAGQLSLLRQVQRRRGELEQVVARARR